MSAREHGLIFTPESIRAMQDDRKWQTRRLIRPQPPHSCHYELNGAGDKALCLATEEWRTGGPRPFVPPRPNSADTFIRVPYQPGDRVWGRTAFWEHVPSPLNRANRQAWDEITRCVRWPTGEVVTDCTPDTSTSWWRRRSPIHMPKWAARVWRTVAAVRPERVQEISEEDALAEGVADVAAFRDHWDAINGKRAPWAANDWVWRIAFDREAS